MRILHVAAPAVVAATVLALTGCFQLPTAPANTAEPAATAPAAETDLAGTTWVGSIQDVADVEFTLNQDGTIDFTKWADQNWDYPSDVWTGSSDSLQMTITNIGTTDSFDIALSGTATDGTLTMEGPGTDGTTYRLVATQS